MPRLPLLFLFTALAAAPRAQAADCYFEPRSETALPGWNQYAWDNPRDCAPRTQFGRIVSDLAPGKQNLSSKMPVIKRHLPGTYRISDDKICVVSDPDACPVDVIRNVDGPDMAWQWLTEFGPDEMCRLASDFVIWITTDCARMERVNENARRCAEVADAEETQIRKIKDRVCAAKRRMTELNDGQLAHCAEIVELYNRDRVFIEATRRFSHGCFLHRCKRGPPDQCRPPPLPKD